MLLQSVPLQGDCKVCPAVVSLALKKSPLSWVCDGEVDCGEVDGSDEADCAQTTNTKPECDLGSFQCVDSGICLIASKRCDGFLSRRRKKGFAAKLIAKMRQTRGAVRAAPTRPSTVDFLQASVCPLRRSATASSTVLVSRARGNFHEQMNVTSCTARVLPPGRGHRRASPSAASTTPRAPPRTASACTGTSSAVRHSRRGIACRWRRPLSQRTRRGLASLR